MLRDILFSSSNCSFVFVISFLASAKLPIPPTNLLPPPPSLAAPPAFCFSFCACIICCRLISAASSRLRFSSASRAFLSASSWPRRISSSRFCCASFFSCSARISFLLVCFSLSRCSSSSSLLLCLRHSLMYSLSPDLLPLGLLLLEPLQLLLLLAPLLAPLVDVLPQLLVQLALLGFLPRLQEVAVSL